MRDLGVHSCPGGRESGLGGAQVCWEGGLRCSGGGGSKSILGDMDLPWEGREGGVGLITQAQNCPGGEGGGNKSAPVVAMEAKSNPGGWGGCKEDLGVQLWGEGGALTAFDPRWLSLVVPVNAADLVVELRHVAVGGVGAL